MIGLLRTSRSPFPRLWTALLAATLVSAACAPAASPSAPPERVEGPTAAPPKPAPTTAPAKPTAAPAKPTEAPAAKPAEQPAAKASPAAKPAEQPAAKASPAVQPAAKPAASPKLAAKATFDERAVADFYRGKTVRIVVGTDPGGGFDTYSRLIARHISKHIPGQPNVIVENMPGAGTMLAANSVYNTAPKDGTVIGNFVGGALLPQLFGAAGVQFDMGRFQHIGVPVQENYVFIVDKRVGVSEFGQLLGPNAKEVAIGAIPGATPGYAPVLLRDLLGARIKVVPGYTGVARLRLAMEGGEIDGMFNTWVSTKINNRQQVESGEWVVLAQMAERPIQGLPVKAPTIPEIAPQQEQRQLLLFGASYSDQFSKLYTVAPEVPADRVAALRLAFVKTMEDREFLAEAENGKLDIDPLTGEEVHRLVSQMLSMPANVKTRLQELLRGA